MRRQGSERAAINAPMQGTAADLVKLAMVAMVAVHEYLRKEKMNSLIIMQVHDELVLEVPLEVSVGVGPNWERAH